MTMTDRVLAILQQRFPLQFEIAVLTAQNEQLAAAANAANETDTTDDAETT
jgi:hypothetical protein